MSTAKKTPAAKNSLRGMLSKKSSAPPPPAISSETAPERARAFDKLPLAEQRLVRGLKLGAIADLLYAKKAERTELNRQVAAIEQLEVALRERLIQESSKSEGTGAVGKVARATVYTEPEPQLESPDDFYAYVKRTGEFDLLQRRLNGKAIKERWAAKKKVPGVGTFNVVKVSLEKLK